MIVKGELHTVTVEGTICAMSAHNLEANALGGFKEDNSALHPTTPEYISTKLKFTVALLYIVIPLLYITLRLSLILFPRIIFSDFSHYHYNF